MFERIARWLGGSKTPPEPKHACEPIDWFPSRRRTGNTSPDPFVCYGHEAVSLAKLLAESTSANTIAPRDLKGLAHILECPAFSTVKLEFVALIAQSRPEFPGEAAEAIQLFRERNRIRGTTIYGAWDYNVERAATRAVACEADGILMPGIAGEDLFRYLSGVLESVRSGQPAPRSVAEHEARLRAFTTSASPFWTRQDAVESAYY